VHPFNKGRNHHSDFVHWMKVVYVACWVCNTKGWLLKISAHGFQESFQTILQELSRGFAKENTSERLIGRVSVSADTSLRLDLTHQ
jgi:hypothetical protein